jgi:hypothetical protein
VKAKRMGRPQLAKKERKATRLSVRFTTDERRAIERAAKAAGVARLGARRNTRR